jgi:hypothetical protein
MSMQNNVFRTPEIYATGGYYLGPGGTYNKTHCTPYVQELDWVAFTPTSSTGTISASTNCYYKVSGNVCIVNFVFNYVPDATVASGSFGGLPFDCKSQVSNTVLYGYDATALFNYSFRLLTTVDAKTFTITGLPTGFTNPRVYTMRGQLMYKIIGDGLPIPFNYANTFYGNTIISNKYYFPGAFTNPANNIDFVQSNAAASSLAAGANMTSLDTNNSVYRITNNTVMFWLAVVFTKNGVAADTVTITGLPENAVFVASAACDITRDDTNAISGGTMHASAGTLTLIIAGGVGYAAGIQYRLTGFIEYQMA